MLGLRLGRHIDGLVDAYYGPAELARQVDSEPLTAPSELVREAESLRRDARESLEVQRARWLDAQLDGLAVVAERLAGRALSYQEEVRRCYGVDIVAVPEDVLAAAHSELGGLLPGTGPLRDRYQAWYRASEIPREELSAALEPVRAELRSCTADLYGLPDGEAAGIELVSNQPWSGFNYYQGGLQSRIAVNTDMPTRSAAIPSLLAHEIYPGHHTEHAWKESLLVRDRGYLEESIFMIGTPQCLVSEGIASLALDALGQDAEPGCEALLREIGYGYDEPLTRAVREIRRRLAGAVENAALMLHEQGVDLETVRSYQRRWLLDPDEQLEHNLDFIRHPVWRTYYVVYEAGQRIVEAWTAGEPGRFQRLLTEQLTTSDLYPRPM